MKQRRGLAGMSPERRRQIAARGQAALRARNKAHVYTPEEGAAARAKQLEQARSDSMSEQRAEEQKNG